MVTGEKIIIMEDLSSTAMQSGYVFGYGSPLNWGHDLANQLERIPLEARKSPVEIAKQTFKQVAILHRTFWGGRNMVLDDEDSTSTFWLRGCDWLHGKGMDSWLAAQNTAITKWGELMAKISSGRCGVKWNKNLVDCIEASLARISWEDYQNELKTMR